MFISILCVGCVSKCPGVGCPCPLLVSYSRIFVLLLLVLAMLGLFDILLYCSLHAAAANSTGVLPRPRPRRSLANEEKCCVESPLAFVSVTTFISILFVCINFIITYSLSELRVLML